MNLQQREGWNFEDDGDECFLEKSDWIVAFNGTDFDLYRSGTDIFLVFDAQDDACDVAELILSKWNR